MTTLAATMLLAPEYLESVGGTFVVLGAAGLLAAALWTLRAMNGRRLASP